MIRRHKSSSSFGPKTGITRERQQPRTRSIVDFDNFNKMTEAEKMAVDPDMYRIYFTPQEQMKWEAEREAIQAKNKAMFEGLSMEDKLKVNTDENHWQQYFTLDEKNKWRREQSQYWWSLVPDADRKAMSPKLVADIWELRYGVYNMPIPQNPQSQPTPQAEPIPQAAGRKRSRTKTKKRSRSGVRK